MGKAARETSPGLLVSLRVWEIDLPVGVTPDELWEQGDLVAPPASHRHVRRGWRLRSTLARDAPLASHVDQLLTRAGGLERAVGNGQGEVQLSVAVYCESGRCPAIALRPTELERLSALKAAIDVDVYCW